MDPLEHRLRPLSDAVVLVTGGGTGIGRAAALELHRQGARLAICGRRAPLLDETVSLIAAEDGECVAIPTDVREPDQVDALLDAVLERYGRIDVLLNNAGGQFSAPAEEISLKGFRAVHRLAVDAVWDVTQKVAVRSMIPNRSGVIVFIGFSPPQQSGVAHATAARAAIENLTAGLSNEWSRYGIRTVCVAVGNVRTDGAVAAYGAEALERWERAMPQGRLGEPEEVARVIAFAASTAASLISGSTIRADGGQGAWGAAAPPPPPG
jgi:citronellol/citronellal dehydrogenase